MIKVKQAIVVEGRYDKNALLQIFDCPVFETNGFSVMHDEALISLLRKTAAARGLVILTDSDGAGFVIRNYLKGVLGKNGVLHAYIPDVPGKEKRKKTPGREDKLGVEGMRPEVLIKALSDAGAELDGEERAASSDPITKQDLFALGLNGGADSKEKRLALKRALDLPEHLSSNALLQALNVLFTREEFLARCSQEDLL